MAELRHYRYFVEIAQRGSFTAAAASLHVTQSALSEQILMLERQLGCRLFDRGRHGARLTAHGEALFDQAMMLLSVANELEQSARSLQRHRGRPLRLGVTMGPLLVWLPEVLAGLTGSPQRYDIRIEDITTAEIFLKVSIGQLDLGIASLGEGGLAVAPGTGVEVHTLFEDDWVIIVPDGHPFTADGAVPLSALRDQRLVLFPRQYSLRTVLDDFFARAGVSVSPAIETGWLEMALRFVELGMGITVVPRAVTLLYHNVHVVEIDEAYKPRRVLSALYRSDTPRRKTIEKLLHLARERLPPQGTWPPETDRSTP
ncbi:LysR family transcriptional regulator [Rhizohabitans arisaemae]|uniref:LysR family transcriptional regulator n=1 Tax=Rhizohabitans arisaemae TaxID=2720610 RepID=UPI0024B0F41D|nr:LysR family transcriptional regulator [Rhizohabitans arisaemae]